jgi:diguanylate cyclase (GGDEF)-like protein
VLSIPRRRLASALLPYAALWLVCAGAIASVAIYELRAAFDRATESAYGRLENVTQLMREHAVRAIDGIERPMDLITALRAHDADPALVRAMLRAMHRPNDVERRFTWFDRDGVFVASSEPGIAPGKVTIADRDYFRLAQQGANNDVMIGEPMIGRVSGVPMLPLAKRLADANGNFDGVLVSALDPLRLSDVYDTLAQRESLTLGLVDRAGNVYVRSGAGRSTEPKAEYVPPAALALTDSAVRDRRAVDGVPSFTAFRRIAATPLVAFAAVREDAAYASYRALVHNVLGFAGLAMLATSLAIVLAAVRAVRDVDRFKALNDQRGHHAGDAALQQIAATLVSSLRSADCVARIGGDEFAILMPGCSAENAGPVLVRLHRALQLASASADLGLGFSIGAVGVQDVTTSTAAVRSEADMLMYETKRDGGGVRLASWQHGALASSIGGYCPVLRHAA